MVPAPTAPPASSPIIQPPTTGPGLSGLPEPAAPIALGLTADAELADVFLSQRRTSADVRERLLSAMPIGMTLVGFHDVWLGEPALPGLVVAGDYQVTLVMADDGPIAAATLVPAIHELLAATSITRPRGKPPTPRAASNEMAPVEMTEMGTIASFEPNRMIDPLPNCFSICDNARSIARAFSSAICISC